MNKRLNKLREIPFTKLTSDEKKEYFKLVISQPVNEAAYQKRCRENGYK